MSEGLGHCVPVFEGNASRRHQVLSYPDLGEQAAAYTRSAGTSDFGAVHTLVQFAGFPRSGHSVVGSLIDAHPDAVVAHELDLMGLLDAGLGRTDFFALICANSAAFERHGRSWNGFSYHVPGGAGGTSRRPRVLGDKKADWAVRRTRKDPRLLERLGALLGEVRAAWVLVVRNPFDNVATMSLRKGRAYDRIRIAAGTPQEFRRKLERARGDRVPDAVLPEMVDDYAGLCDGVAALRGRVPPEDWLVLRHEDLVEDPAPTLDRLFAFLGLEASAAFLSSAAAAVSPTAHRSRHEVRWPGDTRDRVERLTVEHRFLTGYAFDGR